MPPLPPIPERLVKQLIRLRARQLECADQTVKLEILSQEESNWTAKTEKEREKLDKMLNLQQSVETMWKDAVNTMKEKEEDGVKERSALSAELTAKIDQARERTSESHVREQRAKIRHDTLEQQLKLFEDRTSLSGDRYKEVLSKHKDSVEAIRVKQQTDAARIPELEKLLTERQSELEVQSEIRSRLEADVAVYVGRFAKIQESLKEATEAYTAAAANKQKDSRMISTLDGQYENEVRRLQSSRSQRDLEKAKVDKMQEKVDTVVAQITKFNNITKMLLGTEEEKEETNPTAEESAEGTGDPEPETTAA